MYHQMMMMNHLYHIIIIVGLFVYIPSQVIINSEFYFGQMYDHASSGSAESSDSELFHVSFI